MAAHWGSVCGPGFAGAVGMGSVQARSVSVRGVCRVLVVLGGQVIQQVLHGYAHIVESLFPENTLPVLCDLGDAVAGVVEHLPAAGGGEDQLGAPIWRSGRRSR